MTTRVRIAGAPARQFHRDADALAHLVAGEARHALLLGIGVLRSGSAGETPNLTVALQNRDGQCSRLYAALPPIGADAQIRDETGALFSGTVTRVDLDSAQCAVEISA